MEPVTKKPFGTVDGRTVDLYRLSNASGSSAEITNYGGIVVSLSVPDRKGRMDDIVLGFDSIGEYIEKSPHFGCITGRFANRIARGRFTLDGKNYQLATNHGANHLHGGMVGFDKRVWKAEAVNGSNPALKLSYVSPDGEEGYPGTLETEVTYTLTSDNDLRIDYLATTDMPTIVNLTNHSYFNLAGHDNVNAETMLRHELTIVAERYTPIDEASIPLGQLAEVEGTPLDFHTPAAVGKHINDDHPQLKNADGYDHNYVLKTGKDKRLIHAATVYEAGSGRVMEVHTTEPGVQLYTGNSLNAMRGKNGKSYQRRSALCLETQGYPDSPNHPDFPSTILRPGETYTQTTIYAFGTR
ncbi:MAG: aldose epimerase family protein [Pseudomonadota bacterium]